jgi:hypothetical protein
MTEWREAMRVFWLVAVILLIGSTVPSSDYANRKMQPTGCLRQGEERQECTSLIHSSTARRAS